MQPSRGSAKTQRRFLCALIGLLAMSPGAVTLAEEAAQEAPTIDLAELERDIDRFAKHVEAHRAAQGTPRKVGGPITCNDNQCTGHYKDLIDWRFEREDGYSGIRVTPAVRTYVEASSHNCLWKEDLVLRDSGEQTANRNAVISRWVSDMTVADALDSEVSFIWRQSNYSWGAVCVVDRFYVFTTP